MAKTNEQAIPDLSNATPSFLIDEIGRMRVEEKRLKFLDGIYKQALQARISDAQSSGAEFIYGELYQGAYTEKTQERLDSDAVKEYFANDPETLKKLMKVITFKQLDIKPKS